MNDDPLEALQRARMRELNEDLAQDEKDARSALEAQHGRVWSTAELRIDFEIIGFAAPFVAVRCKTTGAKGTMEFTHMPRFYFNYVKD